MTDQEQNKYFRDFVLWQQEGLDIEKQHCLIINFGVNMKFEYPQIRRAIVISNGILMRVYNLIPKFPNHHYSSDQKTPAFWLSLLGFQFSQKVIKYITILYAA